MVSTRPCAAVSLVHWVGVEPTTLMDEISGSTTAPVVGSGSHFPFPRYPNIILAYFIRAMCRHGLRVIDALTSVACFYDWFSLTSPQKVQTQSNHKNFFLSPNITHHLYRRQISCNTTLLCLWWNISTRKQMKDWLCPLTKMYEGCIR